jgi:hypothetical protein
MVERVGKQWLKADPDLFQASVIPQESPSEKVLHMRVDGGNSPVVHRQENLRLAKNFLPAPHPGQANHPNKRHVLTNPM